MNFGNLIDLHNLHIYDEPMFNIPLQLLETLNMYDTTSLCHRCQSNIVSKLVLCRDVACFLQQM